ncbi:MAG: polymer-forming cytoskeletal protein, partial [Bacteroidales bacterium]|nr:polymer-forming cytoskeletal protein [Bacteroidales bacterium]
MAKDNEIENVNNISRISSGTVCTGTIHSKYDLRIDGTFEGKMHSKGRVVVGESAVIKGDVICDNID